ncbi:MAG: hypothetical protein AAF500_03490 [Myxococcota bacterium]
MSDVRDSTHRAWVYAILAFALPVGLAVTAPLRPQGGDTVPAKIGMHVWQCERTFDLAGVEWLRAQVLEGKRPYFAVVTEDRARLVSAWGPAPALWGALTTPPLRPGAVIDDDQMARRARGSAALALGLCALFLFLAIRVRRPPLIALVGAMTAALSFAGAALIGQALWQQSVSCVALCASWWALAEGATARPKSPALGAAIVLSTLAIAIRPADTLVALAGGVLAFSALWRTGRRTALAMSLVGALAVMVAFAFWNLNHLGTWWPSGQALTHRGTAPLFAHDVADVGLAYAGLLLSPSRGLLFFAPVVIVAIVAGARSIADARTFSLSLLVQLVVCAAFYKWWGGVAFGPRLTSAVVWAACFSLFALVEPKHVHGRLVGLAAIVTITVGLIGLYRYDPRKWDLRVDVDRAPSSVWSVSDSTIAASLRPLPPGTPAIVDSPEGPFLYCVDRTLSSTPPQS